MKAPGIGPLRTLLGWVDDFNIFGKLSRRNIKVMSLVLVGVGIVTMSIGLYYPTMASPLAGLSLLSLGVLTLAMSEKTREISENLYARLDVLTKKTDDGFAKMEQGFARLEGKLDDGFAKMEQGFARLEGKLDDGFVRLEGKLDDGFARLEAKIDENTVVIGGKLDKLTAAVERLADSIQDSTGVSRAGSGQCAPAGAPSRKGGGGPSQVGGAETSRF